MLGLLDLPATDLARLTDDPHLAGIHVGSMAGGRGPRTLHDYMPSGGPWKAALVIRPTGWSYRKGGSGLWARWEDDGRVGIVDAPYSEHSSWSELRDCVRVSCGSVCGSVHGSVLLVCVRVSFGSVCGTVCRSVCG